MSISEKQRLAEGDKEEKQILGRRKLGRQLKYGSIVQDMYKSVYYISLGSALPSGETSLV